MAATKAAAAAAAVLVSTACGWRALTPCCPFRVLQGATGTPQIGVLEGAPRAMRVAVQSPITATGA